MVKSERWLNKHRASGKWYNEGGYKLSKKNRYLVRNLLSNEFSMLTKDEYDNRPDFLVPSTQGTKTGKSEKRNKSISFALKGKKKSTSHCENISKSHKEKVMAIDKETGIKVKIPKSVFDENPDRYVGSTKGFGCFIDSNGEKHYCKPDDTDVLNGKYVHILKNRK